jgi:hypothetical protein
VTGLENGYLLAGAGAFALACGGAVLLFAFWQEYFAVDCKDAHFSATLWATQPEDLVVRVSTLTPVASNQVDALELDQP